MRSYSQALDRLRAIGLRPTRQRLALAKLLFDGENRHITAELLHGEASAANVRVSLATVYNTLHQFTEAGILREIVVDSGRSFFDTNASDHYHFFYEDERRLEDFSAEEIEIRNLPAAPNGTEIGSVDVIVRLRSGMNA